MAAPFRNYSRLAANLRSKLPSVVNKIHSNHEECLRNQSSMGISVKRTYSSFGFYNHRTFTLSQTNVNRRHYSTISERTCWKCGNKMDNNEELFFCKCGVVQDIKGLTFFELMGIPESFDIDVTSLTQKYRDLQRQLHPDKHTLKSEVSRLLQYITDTMSVYVCLLEYNDTMSVYTCVHRSTMIQFITTEYLFL